MNTTSRQFSPDRSFDDWTELLSRALETRGCTSLTGYADRWPKASLAQLAAELGGDIPPVILEQRLITEAKSTGATERCVRSLLARHLRAELPDGWQNGGGGSDDEANLQRSRLSGVFLALEMALPGVYEEAIIRVQRALTTVDLPSGWLPDGPDDPALLELFASYWTAHPT
jgi:hypothetical protein